jgi:hypothetical protein
MFQNGPAIEKSQEVRRIMKRITDDMIDFSNYANFIDCQIQEDGKCVEFIYANSSKYKVPIEYLVLWFSNPHYHVTNNELVEFNESQHQNSKKLLRATKWELILAGTAIRLYLGDLVYEIPWDTVLMASEPKYEHFGGLTDKSKKIVNDWWNNKDRCR